MAAAHMMIRKFAMFMKTEALDSQPIFFKLRMIPESMPMPMTRTMAPEKQKWSRDSCAMFMDLLRINTATVKNCCSDCATLMKCRDFLPKRRKKGSP